MDLDTAVHKVAIGKVQSYAMAYSGGRSARGQMWMIVHNNRKDAFILLSDAKEPAGSNANYNGYRILARADITARFYKPGNGRRAPLAGNPTDGFGTVAWQLFLNATYLQSPRVNPVGVAPVSPAPAMIKPIGYRTSASVRSQTVGSLAPSIGATPSTPRPTATRLLRRGVVIQTMRYPVDGSSPVLYAQAATERGVPIGTPKVVGAAVAPYSLKDVDCAKVGTDVTNFLTDITQRVGVGMGYSSDLAGIILTGLETGGVGIPAGIALSEKVQGVLLDPLVSAGVNYASPFWGQTATTFCDLAKPPKNGVPRPSLPPSAAAPGVAVELVCAEYTESTIWTVTIEGGVDTTTVNYHRECIRYELVEY